MNEVRVERRLAAIVCADVVGYSRLIGIDEAGTVAAWRAHREAILPIATRYRGRLVGTQGDGLLFEFASVVDAVAGALAIQACMADRGVAEPEDRRFRLRIGINLGDIIVEGGDILGDGVNVAARLEALADPGYICVSGVVCEQVQGKLPVVFDDLGPRSVKNIARAVHAWRVRPAGSVPPPAAVDTAPKPVDAPAVQPRTAIVRPAIMAMAALLMLGVAALGTWLTGTWPWSGTSRPPGVAIMVLPFESPAGQDQEYFSDGITEDIITALSKMAALANQQNLRVIGRSTSFSWKGRKTDVRQLGRELGITHALVGSVRRDGGRLRISAELIDAWSGQSDWAERYDRDSGAVFDIQDEVTGKVVSTLMAMLDVTSAGNNPLAKPSGKGGAPDAEDPDERRRREEAEARARAAEERRREAETRRRVEPPSAPRPAPADSASAPPTPSAAAPKAARPSPSVTAPSPPPPAIAAAPPARAVLRPAPEVYDLLLQARLLAAKGDRQALLEARALLLRAVAKEPGYVPLQMALADTYRAAYERRWDDADGAPEGLEAALRSIDAALALTADAPMALAMRSLVLAHLGRHDEAKDAAARAVAAKDADAAVLDRAARTLVLVGDSQAALDVMARARKLDPVPSSAALAVESRALFLLGRDADAAKSTEACLARTAADRDCLEMAAATAARLDKRDAARAALAKLTAIDPSFVPETPRIRFAKSYRNNRDLEAIVEALRKAGA